MVKIKIDGQAPLTATKLTLEQLRCATCGELFTADIPEAFQYPDKYSPTARSVLTVIHYGAGLPFSRLEKLQKLLNTPVPDATQWEQVELVADCCYPSFNQMIYLAAQAYVFAHDDTGVRILSLMKENKESKDLDRKGMYTTGIIATGEHPIVLFFSGRDHSGDNATKIIRQREDGLEALVKLCDALNMNNLADESITNYVDANCNSHARRKFDEIKEFFPEGCAFPMEQFQALYKNEAYTKKMGMSKKKRLRYHQQHSTSIMNDLKTWAEKQLKEGLVEPNSSLGKACRYLLNHWNKLTLFLRVAGVPLDTNAVERILKYMILLRKNSLFFKNTHGAYVGSLLMSMIATCEMNKVNPIHYFDAMQNHKSRVFKAPEKGLPWNTHRLLETTAMDTEPPLSSATESVQCTPVAC